MSHSCICAVSFGGRFLLLWHLLDRLLCVAMINVFEIFREASRQLKLVWAWISVSHAESASQAFSLSCRSACWSA